MKVTAVSIEGYVDDWILGTLPWGFDLADVQAPSFVWFGEQDAVGAPIEAALTAALPYSSPFGCPDCRHYVPVAHWPQILEQVTTA